MGKLVLHFTEASGAGVLHALSALVASQCVAGFRVHVLLQKRGDSPSDEELRQMFRGAECKFVTAPRKWNFRAAWKLGGLYRAYVEEEIPEVIHLHSTWAGSVGRLVSVLLRLQSRTVYSPHGWPFLRQDSSIFLRAVYWAVESVLGRFSAGVVAVSSSEANAAPQWRRFASLHVAVLENAVFPWPRSKDSWACQSRLSVVSSGRIVDQKAPWVFGNIARRCSDIGQFVWIGDGDPINRKRWLEDSGVQVTGWLAPDVGRELVRTSDIFVMASKWEGMPMALIEAQCMGLPVIASDVSGNSDVIDDRVSGFLVGSEVDLERVVRTLAGDVHLRREVGSTAASNAAVRFAVEIQAARVVEVYRTLIPLSSEIGR